MDTDLDRVVLVKNINPGIEDDYRSSPKDSYARNFIEFDNKLYFTAADDENGHELWVSDGTTEGTKLLKDIYPGISNDGFVYSSSPADFVKINDRLYFTANDGTGEKLWVTDGTTEGIQLVADIASGTSDYFAFDTFTELNGKLYFGAYDEKTGRELWVSDGTAEGTNLVVDLTPGASSSYAYSSYIRNLTESNGKLYLSANDGKIGQELWVSNGTAEGTQLVLDIAPGASSSYAYSSDLNYFTEFDGKLYFAADNRKNGSELWVSDGTAESTQLVLDIAPGDGGSSPHSFTEFNDKLYFSASDGKTGSELWVSDGTAEGTQLVLDIAPGIKTSYGMDGSAGEKYVYPASSSPSSFFEFNNKLYFSADDGETGSELWVSDGTAEGTQLVANINPMDPFVALHSSYPRNLTVVGDELFFSADNGETGQELFKLTFDDSDAGLTYITGTSISDIQFGGEGCDQIEGLKGNDTLGGKAGNDILNGNSDDDVLFGVNGDDTLTGGAGNDLLRGQSGNDVLHGDAGDDTLFGGSQFDRLNGGDGNDFLDGVRGITIYNGGAGSDQFVIYDDSQTVWIQDFEIGMDNIKFTGSITFDRLEITGSVNSFVSFQDEQIAVLLDVNPDDLAASNFQKA